MAVPVWTAGLEKNAPAGDLGLIKVKIVSNAINELVKTVKKLKKKTIAPRTLRPFAKGNRRLR